MGKVKEKLPTPDTNPVDGDKLIEETKPKVSKKVKEDAKVIAIEELSEDLEKLGQWIADVDEDLKEVSDLVERLAKRLGLYE